jgi:hypothetical protein
MSNIQQFDVLEQRLLQSINNKHDGREIKPPMDFASKHEHLTSLWDE